jgi:hypothetical protein
MIDWASINWWAIATVELVFIAILFAIFIRRTEKINKKK